MNNKLTKQSPVTLQAQLEAILREKIKSFSINSKFTTERALMKEYCVSQAVVRATMEKLQRDGLIEKQPPRGTFVISHETTAPSHRRSDIAICTIYTNDNTENPAYSELLESIETVLQQKGYDFHIKNSHYQGQRYPDEHWVSKELDTVSKMLRQFDGVIWISPNSFELPELPPELDKEAHRLVFINKLIHLGNASCIVRDETNIMAQLVSLLHKKGKKSFAYVDYEHERYFSVNRFQAFCRALQIYGLNLPPERHFRVKEGATKKIIDRICAMEKSPDVLVCATDNLSIEICCQLLQRGIKVPEDIAICGYDNVPATRAFSPSLTSARADYMAMGKIAAQLLCSQLESGKPSKQRIFVPGKIYVRQST